MAPATGFGVIIGTGCGGGVVVNGRLPGGPNTLAGEWSHNPLPGYSPEHDGPVQPCYCGRINYIERFLSGTGLAARFGDVSGVRGAAWLPEIYTGRA